MKIQKVILLIFLLVLGYTMLYGEISLSDQGFLVGAWLGVQASTSGIDNFQRLIDHHLDTVMVYMDWNTEISSIQNRILDPIYNNGSIAILTWEAWGMSNRDVINGSKDAYITRTANDIRNYGREIWIPLFHEGNGNWYPWAIGDSSDNNNSSYVSAYRHVVDLFRNAGANNVRWIFNINCTNNGANTSYLGHYPGDNYVDYLAIDGYNWGTTQDWGSLWQNFDQIFRSAYNALSGINKPMIIDEIASTEIGGDKAAWITDSYNKISNSYPRIKAVSWFSENKETDWRVNSSQASLDAFKAAIKNTSTATPTVTPTPENTPTPKPTEIMGDVNNSGTIDIVDALLIAQYYVGLNPNNFNPEKADVNCSGKIDIVDALLIAQYYVNPSTGLGQC
ncbi:MAG: hypothetical protein JXR70_09975 [Spirochaetales bacterium]|nr:hypothetical protein [Spirochaetales bacterium]